MRALLLTTLLLLSATVSRADDSPLPARDSVNIKLYPVPMALRVFATDVDIGAWHSVTLGPTLAAFHFADAAQNFDVNASWFGVRANFTFGQSRFTDAWFVAPMIAAVQIKGTSSAVVGSENVDLSATVKGSLLGLFAGYQWFWGSGFNMSLGLGAYSFGINPQITLSGTSSGGTTVTLDRSLPNTGGRILLPWAEVGLGWAF